MIQGQKYFAINIEQQYAVSFKVGQLIQKNIDQFTLILDSVSSLVKLPRLQYIL